MPTILTARSGMAEPMEMGMGRGMKKRRGTLHDAQLARLAELRANPPWWFSPDVVTHTGINPRGAAPFKGPNAVAGYTPGY